MAENWDCQLSRKFGSFYCLRDIRDFILHEFPDGPPETWALVAETALTAARSGDTADVEATLALVMAIDGRRGNIR